MLSIKEILLFSALMSCTDVQASVACIKFEERPKLFSIVFGESILNDAFVIILFNQIDFNYTGTDTFGEETWSILYSFIY